MRILIITNMYPTSQEPYTGTFVEQQVKGLKQIGLEVDVMFLDRHQKGMRVYLDLGRKVRAWTDRLQPDIVHVMYGGVMADRVTQSVSERPIVVTFHGSDLLGEQTSGPSRQIVAAYGVRASWRAARRASALVVVANILRDALPASIDSSKIKVIPCGIDLARFKPLDRDQCRCELGWSFGRFHVLFPSHSNNSVKRYGLARAAVKLLIDSGKEVEMHELAGLPNDKVPIWLNASDVLLLTSLHEASPTIVKEALACNIPVVSVDVGDVRERIQGIDGCYIARAGPEDLAAKLIQVLAGTGRVEGHAKMQDLSLLNIGMRLKECYGEALTSFRSHLGHGNQCTPPASLAARPL